MRITFGILLVVATHFFINAQTTGTVKDIDANVYQTVQIGKQLWMTENLRTERYSNGDSIMFVMKNRDWGGLSTGARCIYNNLSENEVNYGMLYNWYAVNDPRGICPNEWRIPTDTDWQTLADFLGGEKTAGSKLKTTVNFGKESTNSTGFNALPGGYRMFTGKYLFQNEYAGFWSSTSGNEEFAWIRILSKYETGMTRMFFGKKNGVSCRCIKDVQ